jgi:hypothetical protein
VQIFKFAPSEVQRLLHPNDLLFDRLFLPAARTASYPSKLLISYTLPSPLLSPLLILMIFSTNKLVTHIDPFISHFVYYQEYSLIVAYFEDTVAAVNSVA